MTYLALSGLKKAYGLVLAVEQIDLAVSKGEFVSLLGPSGCGKTTTLQMIAGFVEPTSGTINLDGIDLAKLPPERRGLGIVFQSYALFPHMTVEQNIAFGLEMRSTSPGEICKRVNEILTIVGLTDKGARYPRQLSGGQQQRVALARALVIRPAILLLDEPLSNLDARMREDMQIELRGIQRKLGTTTVLVTHDQQEALALSDRIVVMNEGRVEQIGAPVEVYDRPLTPFVASFLGKTNRFVGDCRDGKVAIEGHTFPVRDQTPGRCLITIRPEKLRFIEPGSGGIPARVMNCVFQGNHWLFHVNTAHGSALVICQNDGTAKPAEGDAAALSFRPEDAVVAHTPMAT